MGTVAVAANEIRDSRERERKKKNVHKKILRQADKKSERTTGYMISANARAHCARKNVRGKVVDTQDFPRSILALLLGTVVVIILRGEVIFQTEGH